MVDYRLQVRIEASLLAYRNMVSTNPQFSENNSLKFGIQNASAIIYKLMNRSGPGIRNA
jgi:hypothetical protein